MNQGLEQLRAWGRSGLDGVSDLGVNLLVTILRALTWIEDHAAAWPQRSRDLLFDTRMFWAARWRPAIPAEAKASAAFHCGTHLRSRLHRGTGSLTHLRQIACFFGALPVFCAIALQIA